MIVGIIVRKELLSDEYVVERLDVTQNPGRRPYLTVVMVTGRGGSAHCRSHYQVFVGQRGGMSSYSAGTRRHGRAAIVSQEDASAAFERTRKRAAKRLEKEAEAEKRDIPY